MRKHSLIYEITVYRTANDRIELNDNNLAEWYRMDTFVLVKCSFHWFSGKILLVKWLTVSIQLTPLNRVAHGQLYTVNKAI